MTEPILQVDGLKAWYGAAQILFDLSFEIGRGEVVALMGRNGAGKSTTMKTLMALIARRAGTVRFLGEDISRLKAFEIARRGLGFRPGGPPHLRRPHRAGESRHRLAAASTIS